MDRVVAESLGDVLSIPSCRRPRHHSRTSANGMRVYSRQQNRGYATDSR